MAGGHGQAIVPIRDAMDGGSRMSMGEVGRVQGAGSNFISLIDQNKQVSFTSTCPPAT